jgi:hypothetical protein
MTGLPDQGAQKAGGGERLVGLRTMVPGHCNAHCILGSAHALQVAPTKLQMRSPCQFHAVVSSRCCDDRRPGNGGYGASDVAVATAVTIVKTVATAGGCQDMWVESGNGEPELASNSVDAIRQAVIRTNWNSVKVFPNKLARDTVHGHAVRRAA